MKRKFQKMLLQSAFSLLCTANLHANIIKSWIDHTSSDFGVGVSSLLAEQSYLDHYAVDKSNKPLKSFYIKSSTVLINQGYHTVTFDSHRLFYPTISTSTFGGSLAYQADQAQSHRQGFRAGFGYTDFNGFNFSQAAFGYELAIFDLNAALNGFIPLGKTQTYPGVNGSQLVSMYGFSIDAIKKVASHVDFFFQGTYHWEKSTKSTPLGIAIGVDYHLPYLSISSTGQYRNGIDSKEYGGSLYANIPLLKGVHKKSKNRRSSQYTSIRTHSTVISAKEITCTGGARSYSYYGTTTCQSSNPFDSAHILKSDL